MLFDAARQRSFVLTTLQMVESSSGVSKEGGRSGIRCSQAASHCCDAISPFDRRTTVPTCFVGFAAEARPFPDARLPRYFSATPLPLDFHPTSGTRTCFAIPWEPTLRMKASTSPTQRSSSATPNCRPPRSTSRSPTADARRFTAGCGDPARLYAANEKEPAMTGLSLFPRSVNRPR